MNKLPMEKKLDEVAYSRAVQIIGANQLHFRNQFREARICAIDDGEDFHRLLHEIEGLGSLLYGSIRNLGKYKDVLRKFVSTSELATNIPDMHRDWHVPFEELLKALTQARNDAYHQGSYARNLTAMAIQVGLVLEDAIMAGAGQVSDFMVHHPICAVPWQPISFIRQKMLSHSFSYLPIRMNNSPEWQLISDHAVAVFLRARSDGNPAEDLRKKRLAMSLEEAAKEESRLLIPAKRVFSSDSVPTALGKLREATAPVLLCFGSNSTEPVGILTAFDLL